MKVERRRESIADREEWQWRCAGRGRARLSNNWAWFRGTGLLDCTFSLSLPLFQYKSSNVLLVLIHSFNAGKHLNQHAIGQTHTGLRTCCAYSLSFSLSHIHTASPSPSFTWSATHNTVSIFAHPWLSKHACILAMHILDVCLASVNSPIPKVELNATLVGTNFCVIYLSANYSVSALFWFCP